MPATYLPTGCPNNHRDPAARRDAMQKARKRLLDERARIDDQVEIVEHEIALCAVIE